MTLTRTAVLEALTERTDSATGETVRLGAFVEGFDAPAATVRRHLDSLDDCDLATVGDDGMVRITTTGEEYLALDIDGPAVVA
ncbi:MAG: hypothetical protein ABEH56_06955 [Salinirussus sp.]